MFADFLGMATSEKRVSVRSPARTRARAVAALLVAGAALVAISLVLPHPEGGDEVALVLTALSMALAGGVSMMLSPGVMASLCAMNALAPDGRSKPFDAAADGYGRGEGAG